MTSIFQRYLEFKKPELILKKQPALYFDTGEFLPSRGDLPPGAQYITQELVRQTGEAGISPGRMDDIPLSNIIVEEESFKVMYLFAKAEFTQPELDSYQFAQSNGQIYTNIQEGRLEAVRIAIAQKSHDLGAFGSTAHGIEGILNNSDVAVDTDTTFNPYDSNTTPQQIIDYISESYTTIWNNSNFVERPNCLFVSPKLYRLLETTYRGADNSDTVLDSIFDCNTTLDMIVPVRELDNGVLESKVYDTSAPGYVSKERLVLLSLNSDHVVRHYNLMEFSDLTPQGFTSCVYGYKGVSSVNFRYPGSAGYFDYAI